MPDLREVCCIITLRNFVGWKNFSDEQVFHSLNNSVYDITVVENEKTIAIGRLIGDGIYYFIVDIVVNPALQVTLMLKNSGIQATLLS